MPWAIQEHWRPISFQMATKSLNEWGFAIQGKTGEKKLSDINQRQQHLRGHERHRGHYVNSRETTQGSQWRSVCHGHQPNRFSERPSHEKAESKSSSGSTHAHMLFCWQTPPSSTNVAHTHKTIEIKENLEFLDRPTDPGCICKPKAFLFKALMPFAKILLFRTNTRTWIYQAS